jgi:putative transposase
MIETNHPQLSVRRQCELVGLSRATLYRRPRGETPVNLRLMRLIDEEYTRTPFYGYRKMTARLNMQGYAVNRKRVARLMRTMGLRQCKIFDPVGEVKDSKQQRRTPWFWQLGYRLTKPKSVVS